MSRWNVFCNESAPYRIYYRQIEIDGYEMYAMFPLPMTGMECGWAVSHGATTAATIHEAVQKFYKILSEEGITVSIRREMGRDIAAACGQLRLGHS